MIMRMIRKDGQVWVETVIYTLIGLAIIALVLTAALPKINAKKDEMMIEQSIEALGNIDSKVYPLPLLKRRKGSAVSMGLFPLSGPRPGKPFHTLQMSMLPV